MDCGLLDAKVRKKNDIPQIYAEKLYFCKI